MATAVIMPKVDMDQENATIIEWLKTEGDTVEQDDIILTVETGKVAIDVVSPASGIISGIKYDVGDVVPVATEIAFILNDEEALTNNKAAPVITERDISKTIPAGMDVPVDIPLNDLDNQNITEEEKKEIYADQEVFRQAGKISATPASRRLSIENNIPIINLEGSGPHGRIQAKDVLAGIQNAVNEPKATSIRTLKIINYSGVRQTIGSRMQKSFNEAPHIAETIEVDATEIERYKIKLQAQAENQNSPKISITTLLVKLVAWALERNPIMNASLVGQAIHLWEDINIGVATTVESGLIVPVIHNANKLTISQIASRINLVTTRARSGDLELGDVSRGTFTISNLGMYGIHQFRAVINPPESAILAVGAIIRKPIVVEGSDTISIRPTLSLTIAADHRVIDGIEAARFLTDLAEVIECPELLVY